MKNKNKEKKCSPPKKKKQKKTKKPLVRDVIQGEVRREGEGGSRELCIMGI